KPKRRGRSGQTILEFRVATGDSFRSITGNSITQTQQKIIDILHMDYPTFTNSAFLRQGRADEFTVKRPVERKQVLADILGLSVYDELEERAKDLAKQQETEKGQLESAIKDINDELARKPTYEAEFKEAQSQLSRIEKVATEQESRLNEMGQQKESLDINTSDELGTRNYEMFSGGEAFRINFAIRIALSKLLAKRAGAPLPTLVIDEGFGTQDSAGIEKLKEAINSIQDDFDKILVITHIEELRDAFPTSALMSSKPPKAQRLK
ncbi:unnamed protein product, partial [marine sediment metagenome]